MARTRASTRSGARPFAALEPRAVLEMCVSALTTALAVASLRAGGRARESWALAALGVAALWGEGARWWRLLPEAREGVQGGVHLGVLALPWTFAARDHPGALWPCVVAGFAAIAASTAPTTRGAAKFARPALAAAALAASVAAAAGLLPPDRDRASTLALAAALALHARLAVALAAWIPPAVPGALTRAEAILAANGFTLAVALAAARTARELHLAPAWLPPSLDARALPDALERARAMIVACVVLACALLVAARAFVGGATPTPTPTRTPRAASRGLTASARASPPPARPRGAPLAAAAVMLALAAAFAHAWGLAPFPNPVAWTARRVLASGASARRLAAFWSVVLGGGLSAVNRVARLPGAPRTLFLRKLYHALAVAAFAPPALPAAATAALGLGLPEPEILALAYAHALALFAAAEVARLADPEVRVPTLGRGGGGGGGGGDDDDGCPKRAWRVVRVGAALDARARRFADHRDPGLAGGARRTVLFSHFSLLVGVALPLWLTPEAWAGGAGGEAGEGVAATLAPFAGVVALGVGDAAAAAAGASGFGGRRTPLCRGWRKTVEGFVAGAVANALASAALWRLAHAGRAEVGGSPGIPAVPAVPWVPVAAASAGAAALEATTEQNDNAFLPLHYFAALSLAARVTGA